MKKVVIYTDGACSCNPGNGGWCAILMYGGKEKVISGAETNTTNNRMELMAVIKGVEALKEKCEVDIYSDSAYVVNAFQQDWLSSWVLNGWKTSNKSSVANVELWKKLLDFSNYHKINFNKVKGHSDNEYNNRCDKQARKEIEKLGK